MHILYIGEIHRRGALFLLLIVWVYRHSRIDGSQECVLPVIRRKCFPADSSLLENTQNHVNVSTTDGTCGPLILSSWHPRMRLKVGGRMIPITGPSLSGPELSGPAFWRFMQIRQRIFNCADMQIMHFILDKILILLTYDTSFYH